MSSPKILTLVGGYANGGDDAVTRAADALRRAGARVEPARTLAVGVAYDLPFSGLDEAAAGSVVRASLGEQPIDLAVQDRDGRRKRLLVADLESTVIRNEMLDELAEIAGLGDDVARITAQAMNGEIDFHQALRDRVVLLAGQPLDLLERARARIEVTPGAATLVATMRAHGGEAVLISGGFHRFADPLGERLGFARVEANRLAVRDGRLTGEVIEPIVDRETKRASLERHRHRLGIERSAVMAVGDGANDLAMLAAAGAGVAFHAKPVVAGAARLRVDHGDLRTLLYFQGYAQDSWQLVPDDPATPAAG